MNRNELQTFIGFAIMFKQTLNTQSDSNFMLLKGCPFDRQLLSAGLQRRVILLASYHCLPASYSCVPRDRVGRRQTCLGG